MINKVLVANRGEIAVRVLRTCRELGLETVGVYSEADREAPHVRYADQAFCIGPPPFQKSYLRGDHIIRVALEAGAQAIHPGYGFLAESSQFAQACCDAGLTFIGPRPETIALFGDKMAARRVARRLRLPILPGSDREIDEAEMLEAAERIGYPLLIKAAAGGGGLGIRVVQSKEQLEAAVPLARKEARTTFGDGSLYIEKSIEGARHIEVQILADAHGHVIHLGERECSIQRRHQKLIEEAPSRALEPSLRNDILRSAVRLARAVKYVGAGTVEFLVDPQSRFYFLEVNPRLQVEHTVTEAITGIDLVKEQLRIASGRNMHYCQRDIQPRGWALECRILAEDPFRNFTACVGRISRLREPGGAGVRVDSGICEGLTITPYYDSMLSKLVTWGETPAVAIVRMRRALEEYQILGITTNLDLHRALLNSHRFFAGQFHTRFLEDQFVPVELEKGGHLQAAITTALLDWRRHAGAEMAANRWKMLGRWELLGGGEL